MHWTAQTSWWGQEGWGYYKNKKQIIPSQPIHKLPDRVKGAGLLQKIKYTINSQPLHKLLMKCRGEWAQKMLIKYHNTAGEMLDIHTTHEHLMTYIYRLTYFSHQIKKTIRQIKKINFTKIRLLCLWSSPKWTEKSFGLILRGFFWNE